MVSMASMVHCPTARRERLDRETAKIISDTMKKAVLGKENWLKQGKQEGVYLVEII
jgi:hypothetical protein